MDALAAALVLAALLAAADGAKLPAYFGKPCSRSLPEPAMSECAQSAANAGIPALTNGDKKLKIPNMNPLVVPRVSLAQGSGQINLNLTWAPLEIYGLRDAKISNMKLSWKEKTNSFDLTFPTFVMAGPYKAAGRILLLPMTGSGPSNFTFQNLKLHYSFDWPLRKGADGKEYSTLVNSKIRITDADGLKCELNGLFNGDRRLGDQLNKFLNDNWRDVLRELGPSMVEAAREVVEAVIKNLINAVPVSDLFAP
ncbi:protein takeout-like [Thrips palmi]|uniref:Protein takeout-like n=1 Tax=Thrips palmi TaxID=161013 RepID=A0A6P8Z331_THRPL|nr:protein takeout-like [Thrips palmi]